MKKIISTFLVLIIAQAINAQKTIDGLIKAEKDFAAYSVANSTKEAFLEFLDSTGVIFDNGKAVNGIEAWSKREKRPGILNWWPQFAEIANSNDFGYTTGPWIFQPSATDTVVARGQYTTVWHIAANGEWKFLIDLGVSNTPANAAREVKKISATKQGKETTTESPLSTVENDFVKLFAKNRSEAYKKYLSKESILNRHGHLPANTATDQQAIIDSTPSLIQFIMDGEGIAQSLDIGYVYGRAILNGKTENYKRIWRHEKAGWKIALEVLRY
jgi:hypothetical protein